MNQESSESAELECLPKVLAKRADINELIGNTPPVSFALTGLLYLFFLRVMGQFFVALDYRSFLPPMEQWQSGLLPYSILLGCQLFIIALFGKICIDIGTQQGFFAVQRPMAGAFLIKFAYVYYLAMVVRYFVQMYLYPDDRWFGHTIPIFFHFVLATFLLLLGRYNKGKSATRNRAAREIDHAK